MVHCPTLLPYKPAYTKFLFHQTRSPISEMSTSQYFGSSGQYQEKYSATKSRRILSGGFSAFLNKKRRGKNPLAMQSAAASSMNRICSLEVCSTGKTTNFQPLKLPELRRRNSFGAWLEYLEKGWQNSDDADTPYQPELIKERIREIEGRYDAAERDIIKDTIAKSKQEHRIRRKPVPEF